MSPPTVQLEPLVSWPQTMLVGQEYLVTVDLRLASPGDGWPYREEEFAFSCMLDGGERIAVESVDDISVILHRFGGTYGPARFVVTARGDAGDDELRLSLSTQRGATVRIDILPVRVTTPNPEDEDPQPDLQTVPGRPRPGRRPGEEGTWIAAIHRGGRSDAGGRRGAHRRRSGADLRPCHPGRPPAHGPAVGDLPQGEPARAPVRGLGGRKDLGRIGDGGESGNTLG
ncbi:hypothetical protein GCM10018952_76670 [Streptosporangium vulgare]